MDSTGGIGDRHAAARGASIAILRSVLAALTDDAVVRPRTVHRTVHQAVHQAVPQPECRATRAAMHDYVRARLAPSRQRHLEAHLDRCVPCTRAFIDVREVSWALRGLGRRLAADGHPGGRHRRTSPRSRV